uniref:Uncharacterized protein n=1 Tax=uncultured marine group II/III euryarchaeote KM3_85_C06 TaxID=1456526 RepID=A0A075HU06_9EURY|nr:hypothetical protein [uncultured marine group II/III euryarchaeote KM3_85_C06]
MGFGGILYGYRFHQTELVWLIGRLMDKDLATIQRVHRSMSSTLLWLTLLFFFLLISFSLSLDGTLRQIGSFASILTLAAGMSIYYGFSRRKIWAYRLAIVHWLFLILICSLIAIIDLIGGIQGSVMSAIMAIMLIFIVVGMVKRFTTFSNPMFMAWYIGQSTNILASSKLQLNEMMAACPHCLSILAVKPLDLSGSDLCPNCGEKLVSDEVVAKFSTEEE